MKQALTEMLVMQDRMNTRVHENWIEQGFEWYRAVWVECAELMDHHGYKWWKQQRPDLAQLQLEVVDIWHFGMSAIITEEGGVEPSVSRILRELDLFTASPAGVLEAAEKLALHALAEHSFCPRIFRELMEAVGMSFGQLHVAYIGKNVLNFFRQDHGYKSGSYQKLWRGREDNEHLMELTQTLDSAEPDFADQLYRALEQRYRECCA